MMAFNIGLNITKYTYTSDTFSNVVTADSKLVDDKVNTSTGMVESADDVFP